MAIEISALPRSVAVFGAKLTPLTTDETISCMARSIAERQQLIVAAQNMHGLYVMEREVTFAALHALPRTVVYIDGTPLVYLARIEGFDVRSVHRITVLDWIWPLLAEAASRSWRVFFIGGEPALQERLLPALRGRLPNLNFACAHGYFDRRADSSENRSLIDSIRSYDPHLVLVGMGMGIQERWIFENRAALEPASVCIIGACFEYLAGEAAVPPRWSGRLGLEWLFRFVDAPGRFWFRYLVEPLFVARDILRIAALRRRVKA